MRIKFFQTSTPFLISITLSGTVVAQVPPGAGALSRELELQIERSAPPSSNALPIPKRLRAPKSDGQTIEIKSFTFVGNSLFSSAILGQVVAPWLDERVGISEFDDITAAIQDFYLANGRLAQATIPPQQVKDGNVVVHITEGKLGDVIVTTETGGDAPNFSFERAKSFFKRAKTSDGLIDTDQIERSTMLLNEIPGLRAQGSFVSGSKEGTADYRVSLERTPLITGEVATSNYGFMGTGNIQAVANLALNSPTGFGDKLSLDAIQSLGSSFAQLSYAVPTGNDGLYFGAQGSFFRYKTLPSWSAIQTDGSSQSVLINASYALTRSQASNTNLKLELANRGYTNNVSSGPEISNYQLNSANLGFSGNWAPRDGGILNYGLNLIYGHLTINNLNQLGADLTGPGTAGNYTKLGFNLSYLQQFGELGKITWSNALYGQIANKNLNSAEQIFLGGPFAVRAYPVSQGGGSQGGIISSELLYRLLENLQIGAFGDYGVVQQYVNTYPAWQGLTNANNIYSLGDVGLSLKYNQGQLSVNGSLAVRVGNNPLYNSSGQQLNADNAYRTIQGWIRASYSF
jgi:hemolysin activation/secretion protein